MGGVHEPLVGGGAAVSLVDGVPEHAVVAPVPDAVEPVDRQQFDVRDPERDEVIEPTDRGIQRALGCKRSHVQLVDQTPGQLPPCPGPVGPPERAGIKEGGCLVHPPRLPTRPRIGPQRVTVAEDEAVFVAVHKLNVSRPPPALARGHLQIRMPLPTHPHSLRSGRPDLDHASSASLRPETPDPA